jgi:hypothetical protein
MYTPSPVCPHPNTETIVSLSSGVVGNHAMGWLVAKMIFHELYYNMKNVSRVIAKVSLSFMSPKSFSRVSGL